MDRTLVMRELVQATDLAATTRLAIALLTGDDAIHGHSLWPGAPRLYERTRKPT